MFEVGQSVLARNYYGSEKWCHGRIVARTGPISYRIEMGNGVIWRRHADQIVTTGEKVDMEVETRPGPVEATTEALALGNQSQDGSGRPSELQHSHAPGQETTSLKDLKKLLISLSPSLFNQPELHCQQSPRLVLYCHLYDGQPESKRLRTDWTGSFSNCSISGEEM